MNLGRLAHKWVYLYLLYDDVFIDDFIGFGINSMKQYRCPLMTKKEIQSIRL